MMNARHVKGHPHASGAKGGNQDRARTKGGLHSKHHLAVDAHGLPVRMMMTEGTRLYTGTCRNRMGVGSHYLADRGYDTDAILERAFQAANQSGYSAKM